VIKEKLVKTMIKHQAPPYLLAIILDLLSNQSTSLKMEDYLSPPFQLRCGLPQGSPLSPILYIIYNSSLLINNPLDLSQDSISLGFINDVTHLVANKKLEPAINLLEKEGEQSLQWGNRHNAIFDRKKANFMILSHRKLDIRLFNFGNISLPNSSSVKYLGIILDRKLSFKSHLDKVKKCGEQTSNQLVRISRCSYGIGLQQSRNLIISVLQLRVLFGSLIWATSRNEAAVENIINKINNAANCTILGMFRTTPINVLSRESPLIPFFDILKKKNHSFVIKKFTAPESHPIKRLLQIELNQAVSSHPSPIHNIFDRQSIPNYDLHNIERIQHHMIKPWDDFKINIRNIGIKKEEAKTTAEDQIEVLNTRQEHIIFTDGSSIPEKGTASAAILNCNQSIACRINSEDKASLFEAEVVAVKFGLDIVINKLYDPSDTFQHSSKNLNFFIDNQATILSISHAPLPKSSQLVFHEIYTKMKLLIELFNFSISLYWCPAHVGITENEAVNQLAKDATEGNHH
jgi:ribonuclease HI